MAANEPLFGFNTTQKKTLIDFVGELGVSAEQAAAVAALTQLSGTTGGTANNTLTTVPLPTAVAGGGAITEAASQASTLASITAIRDDLADINGKINQIMAALKL